MFLFFGYYLKHSLKIQLKISKFVIKTINFQNKLKKPIFLFFRIENNENKIEKQRFAL